MVPTGDVKLKNKKGKILKDYYIQVDLLVVKRHNSKVEIPKVFVRRKNKLI